MSSPQRCCIDSCVCVKYPGHFKAIYLLRNIAENNLLEYADNFLFAEIYDTMIISFGFTVGEADKIIQFVSPFAIINALRNIFRLSGGADDSYLYNIYIQNNCSHLITIEGEILSEMNATFVRKTDASLKRK